MKRNLMVIGLLLCSVLMITGCGNNSNKNEIDIEAENVLACTSMKYNIFGLYSTNVIENHVFLAEYDESKTNIEKALEVYTADYSKTEKELTKEDLQELKEGLKTRFCDVRKKLITPDGYEGEEVTCNITDKDNVITVKIVYPKAAIEYAKDKGKLGALEEFKKKVEADDTLWFYHNYFTCDKSYDKSKFINEEIKKTLNLNYSGDLQVSNVMRNVVNEINMYNRFDEEVFEQYKVDTLNRVTLKPINEEKGYVNGDYILTYNCAAESEDTCNKVTDYIINLFTERAKDFKVKVTKK